MIAVAAMNLEMSRLLLKCKADVNLPGVDGETALMAAAKRGSRDMVKLLVHCKADPLLVDKNKRTAFDYSTKGVSKFLPARRRSLASSVRQRLKRRGSSRYAELALHLN